MMLFYSYTHTATVGVKGLIWEISSDVHPSHLYQLLRQQQHISIS